MSTKLLLFLLIVVSFSCTNTTPTLMELPPPSNDGPEEVTPEAAPEIDVLVFSKTNGYRHKSIEMGIEAIELLGEIHNFDVYATENASFFKPERLDRYEVIVFLNTSGEDVLDAAQKQAFEQYIQQGGGFVGIHGAAATGYEWAWYGELVGAFFEDHPEPQKATVMVLDRSHPSTQHLPARWERFDEWYNYRTNPQGNVHVLAALDEQTYEGGTMGYDHPISWAHEFDGGRSWYTGLGHTQAAYTNKQFLDHIFGGIQWAAGVVDAEVGATLSRNYKKTVLMDEVTDPMEIAIAADGRVFLAERAGAMKMWDPQTGTTKDIGWIPVYMVIEDGLLGLTLDPDFMENNWLYVFYAPEDAGPSRLSRFTLAGEQIDMDSEKILLEVPFQRKDCCHAGGSLTFDANGNLYLSTGDNTNPYDRNGNPIDEREGRAYADAQRTSGNTNDLRGKILRIHPEDDGTYTIPEGNLFDGDDLHRPEIYTMGHRNPFRISVDPETGWLYWGDVGNGDPPNERGGWGYDEFNQARGPGFFGWPYFSGKNQAYNDYDYATEIIGGPFNPAAPVNDSPNNTGATNLPPAQSAMIAYTYGVNEDFPGLGAGGVNPMAGPVYRWQPTYSDKALPAYFEGSHIIYEWMRNWVMEVKFDDKGDILKVSPFLPGIEFVRPIDMEIGPDGALYVAEWGDAFWGSNPDARVVRIAYDKDRMQQARTLPAPANPNVVRFNTPADGSFFSFDEPLNYSVTVTDPQGRTLENQPVTISTYSGFDTHRIMLHQQTGQAGQATVTTAFTHTPDLHLQDRFAELEACTTNKRGFTYCDRIKLHPKKKQAEHISWHKAAKRHTHSAHPAAERFAQTALITMQVENGSALAYTPVDLSGVNTITLRYKQYQAGTIVLREDAVDGREIGRIDLAASDAVAIDTIPQLESVDLALQHDEAILVSGLNPDVYKNWSEVTIPVQDAGTANLLVLTFEGPEKDMLLELDWIKFE